MGHLPKISGPRRAIGSAVFVVFSIACATPIQAEPAAVPVLERSALERVIRQSAVDTFYQDPEGFLWLGTREGLVRWDGNQARTWVSVPFDETSLRDNIVVDIDRDAEGHLWLVTRGAIHGASRVARLVAPELERFVHYPHEDVELAMSPDGEPWLVGVDAIFRRAAEEDRFDAWMQRRPVADEDRFDVWMRRRVRDPLSSRAVFDQRGDLWILDAGGLDRCRVANRSCQTMPIEPEASLRLWPDGDRVRISTSDGIACLDQVNRRLEPCEDLEGFSPGTSVSALARDARGSLWLATLEGLWRASASGLVKVSLDRDAGSAGDDIYNLLGDHSGGVWAGTPWGLLYWDPHRQPFELVPIGDRATGLSSSALIMALHEDVAGTVWIGTIGDGLYALSPSGSWRHFPERSWMTEAREEASFVWSIAGTGGHVWLATTYGLVRVDRSTGHTTRVELPEPMVKGRHAAGVRKVLVDASDQLWVLSYWGQIWRLENGGFERVHREVPAVEVEEMAIAVDGTIWLGTSDDGLRRIEPVSGETRALRHVPSDPASLASRGVFALHLDQRGDLWVGTTRGLDRLASSGDTFEHVLGPQDLPSSAVLAIQEGPRRLWLATNRGLVSVDKDLARRGLSAEERRRAVAIWDLDDGVGNLELNRGAVLRARDGKLLFGGDRGITRFRPEEIRRSTYRPPIRLEKVTAVDRRGVRNLDPVASGPIEIAPGVSSFTVELGTVDFSSPPRNRFAMRLVGVDPDWIELGTRRVATYVGVPPGHYTLRARVSNADGVWSAGQLELPLVVVPPFYRTSLFRVASSVAAALSILALGAMAGRRRYRRQLERLRVEQQREEDRRRISRDLHDELGAGLTQIVLLSEKELRSPSTQPESLRRIADGARGLIEGIREIIWSIDPQHDRLDRLAARLRGTAAEMLEAAELRAELDFPEALPELAVAPRLRRNLSLILREAVHNAVRHSGARTVRVRFAHLGETLELEVADDGRGLDEDAAPSGHGQRNIRERAAAVDGRATIETASGGGVRVRVQMPLESVRSSRLGDRALDGAGPPSS